MKIKFLKPFRLYNPIGDDMMMNEGAVENMEKEDYAQWLINNGFAEKVEDTKESGWKPEEDDTYYYVRYTLSIFDRNDVGRRLWTGDETDQYRYSIGNVFKTIESVRRFIDYLKAVEAVRHDEGFMKPSRKINYSPCGYGVYRGFGKSIIAEVSDTTVSAGEFYFDSPEHSKASLDKHPNEWQTILNYDWSKGEEEEDED